MVRVGPGMWRPSRRGDRAGDGEDGAEAGELRRGGAGVHQAALGALGEPGRVVEQAAADLLRSSPAAISASCCSLMLSKISLAELASLA